MDLTDVSMKPIKMKNGAQYDMILYLNNVFMRIKFIFSNCNCYANLEILLFWAYDMRED